MEVTVNLPTLHPGQCGAYGVIRRNRFTAVRCGRRWGKTDLGKVLAADAAIKGGPVGWFAPDYKTSSEAFTELAEVLDPVITSSNQMGGVMRLLTRGRIDFWTLENERAGRSRKYRTVIIDEGAFTKPIMMSVWEKSIKPTLLDYAGNCVVLSNTNGVDEENFFYQICTQPKYGFSEYHAPSRENPYLPAEELAKLERDNHPLVYRQEYLAEFVDWSGEAFFSLEAMLDNGQPVSYPHVCDTVFAVIDTAVKDGKDNDGTAVVYFALSRFSGFPLVVVDWDIVQIEGALLETWLPTVFTRIDELSKLCHARLGVAGAIIEDAAAGSILLQQARRRQWAARPAPEKLKAAGKDGRAINISGYHHRGEVKIAKAPFDKAVTFKGITRNHFLTQVTGYRVGDREAARRADDLTDCYTYGVAIGLGNEKGN